MFLLNTSLYRDINNSYIFRLADVAIFRLNMKLKRKIAATFNGVRSQTYKKYIV